MPRAVLRRIGNSIGLVLPKDYVRAKKLRAGDEVDIEVAPAAALASVRGALKVKLSTDKLNDLVDEGEDLG